MQSILGSEAWANKHLPARLSRGCAWLVLFCLSGVLLADDVQRLGVPEGVDVYRDIVYRKVGRRETHLDVYVPKAPAPVGGRPTLLAIHGGAWLGGSKNGYGRAVARLCRAEYVVVSVSYRLARPKEPGWPENFEDVREAVRWIRRHHAEYGVDPARIAAIGASAGGHLASLLGTYSDGRVDPEEITPSSRLAAKPSQISARVAAVICFYGPSDLTTLLQNGQEVVTPLDLLLGGSQRTKPKRYVAASPLSHVTADDAPHLLVHGVCDVFVPIDQTNRLAAALKAAGVRHKVIRVENAGHGFGLDVNGQDLTHQILAFLDQTWHDQEVIP
jgi:acetyl esterase/lipase